MKIKTPKFWYADNGGQTLLSRALGPISALYQHAHRSVQSGKTPQNVDIPVICVGNITAGGGGKTPSCMALAELLKAQKPALELAFLTRGFGGRQKDPLMLTGAEPAEQVGDEPLLLARCAKTIIATDRYRGAKFAAKQGAQMLIMDDGLYHQGLQKDLSFLVIDGAVGLGNGKTLPAGPLRERLEETLTRIHAIILIGQDAQGIASFIPEHTPIFRAEITAKTDHLNASHDYIAFSGIARPEKFFKTLRDHNIKCLETNAFPDHHMFSERELQGMLKRARDQNAHLITTEKDFVRLLQAHKNHIHTLPIGLKWDNAEDLGAFIETRIT